MAIRKAMLILICCVVLASPLRKILAAGPAFLRDIATDLTDPSNLADSEPSIAVDRFNPNRIAVVTFSENATTTIRAPVWKSDDGGLT